MRSHIGGRGEERIIFNKGVETFPKQMRFTNLEGKSERESSKRTVSIVRLGCYKWYQSQTLGGVPTRILGPEERVDCEWTLIGERNECQRERRAPKGVDYEILHWLQRGTKHCLQVKTSTSRCILKTLRGSPKAKDKAQRGQYLLSVGLGGPLQNLHAIIFANCGLGRAVTKSPCHNISLTLYLLFKFF